MNVENRLIDRYYSSGRYGSTLEHVVLHTIVGNLAGADATFHAPALASPRSAHYGIGFDGKIIKWVDEGNSAWHAGDWPENTRSIGIEHEDGGNYNDGVRTDALYASSIALIADIFRRHGWKASEIDARIRLHREFAKDGRTCPAGLDVARIKQGVAQQLGIVLAVAPVAEGLDYTPTAGTVTVTNSVLIVRSGPGTGFQGGVANTPDGNLHAGNTVNITGYAVGEDPYGDGRNVWLRSKYGRYFWAGGTNFEKKSVELAPAAPAPAAPVVEQAAVVVATDLPKGVVPLDLTATVTATAGVRVRSQPAVSAPANQGSGDLEFDQTFEVTGAAYGDEVSGNNIWLRSIRGNWIWSGGTNVSASYLKTMLDDHLAAQAVPAAAPVVVQQAAVVTTVDAVTAPAAPAAVEAEAVVYDEPTTDQVRDTTKVIDSLSKPAAQAVATKPAAPAAVHGLASILADIYGVLISFKDFVTWRKHN